jgi:hypothetical protein
MKRLPMFMNWQNEYCKMTVTTESNLRFNAITIKIPMSSFTEIEKSIQKLICKNKRSRITKAILSKKSNTGNITIPDFKTFPRSFYWEKYGSK